MGDAYDPCDLSNFSRTQSEATVPPLHPFMSRASSHSSAKSSLSGNASFTATGQDDLIEYGIASRAAALQELFDHSREDTEDRPSWLGWLYQTPASDISSGYDLPQVNMHTSIFDVLRILKQHRNVVVRDWVEDNGSAAVDILWARASFTECALVVRNFYAPVSKISATVPLVPLVNVNDTLDTVLHTMALSGFEEIGTVNQDGIVTGVIHFDSLFINLIEEVEKISLGAKAKPVHVAMIREQSHNVRKLTTRASRRGFLSGTQAYRRNERGQSYFHVAAISFVNQPFVELMMLLLLAMDFTCLFFEEEVDQSCIITGPKLQPTLIVTGVILNIFTFEALVRVFAYRWQLLTQPFDMADIGILIISIVLYAVSMFSTADQNVNFVQMARAARILRLVRVAKAVRGLVGSNRRRYQEDGYDLDLTYISPSIIAMSLPATGAEANYRNPIEEVQAFLYEKHPNHFLVFNLCSERNYDPSVFGGRVERIEVEDHNPPMMSQLVSYLERCCGFMVEDDDNIICVHCKGGKGRTGVFVCAWLLYSEFCESADDALAWFATQRTGEGAKNPQGVTGASQRRYVHYISQVITERGFRTNQIALKKIVMHTCPSMDKRGGCDPWFTIEENGIEVFDSTKINKRSHMLEHEQDRVFYCKSQDLYGDVRVCFYDRDLLPTKKDELMFYFWFHTGFINDTRITLSKEEIDIACVDKKCAIFSKDFKVELHFEDLPCERERGKGLRTISISTTPQEQPPVQPGRSPSPLLSPALPRVPGLKMSLADSPISDSPTQIKSHSPPTDTHGPAWPPHPAFGASPQTRQGQSTPNPHGFPSPARPRHSSLGYLPEDESTTHRGQHSPGQHVPASMRRKYSLSDLPICPRQPKYSMGDLRDSSTPVKRRISLRRFSLESNFEDSISPTKRALTQGHIDVRHTSPLHLPPIRSGSRKSSTEMLGQVGEAGHVGKGGHGLPVSVLRPAAAMALDKGAQNVQSVRIAGNVSDSVPEANPVFVPVVPTTNAMMPSNERAPDDSGKPATASIMQRQPSLKKKSSFKPIGVSKSLSGPKHTSSLGPWRQLNPAPSRIRTAALKAREQLRGPSNRDPATLQKKALRSGRAGSNGKSKHMIAKSMDRYSEAAEAAGRWGKSAGSIDKKVFTNRRRSSLHGQDKADTGAALLLPPMSAKQMCAAPGPRVGHEQVLLFSASSDPNGYLLPAKGAGLLTRECLEGLDDQSTMQTTGNKKIFGQHSGETCDITYITPRLLAVGCPSQEWSEDDEASVWNFFQARHAGKFLMIDCCLEVEEFALTTFGETLTRFGFRDHRPPALSMLTPCCEAMHEYLQADENHVVAVHCSNGKGRTGLVISSYMLYSGLCPTAQAAKAVFGEKRTVDGRALIGVSQIRFLYYFEAIVRSLLDCKRKAIPYTMDFSPAKSPAICIHRIRFEGLNFLLGGRSNFVLTIGVKAGNEGDDETDILRLDGDAVYRTRKNLVFDILPPNGLRVAGDLVISLKDVETRRETKLLFMWLHTYYILKPFETLCGKFEDLSSEECNAQQLPPSSKTLTLTKMEVDQAASDIRHTRFEESFKTIIMFTKLEGESGSSHLHHSPVSQSASSQEAADIKTQGWRSWHSARILGKVSQHPMPRSQSNTVDGRGAAEQTQQGILKAPRSPPPVKQQHTPSPLRSAKLTSFGGPLIEATLKGQNDRKGPLVKGRSLKIMQLQPLSPAQESSEEEGMPRARPLDFGAEAGSWHSTSTPDLQPRPDYAVDSHVFPTLFTHESGDDFDKAVSAPDSLARAPSPLQPHDETQHTHETTGAEETCPSWTLQVDEVQDDNAPAAPAAMQPHSGKPQKQPEDASSQKSAPQDATHPNGIGMATPVPHPHREGEGDVASAVRASPVLDVKESGPQESMSPPRAISQLQQVAVPHDRLKSLVVSAVTADSPKSAVRWQSPAMSPAPTTGLLSATDVLLETPEASDARNRPSAALRRSLVSSMRSRGSASPSVAIAPLPPLPDLPPPHSPASPHQRVGTPMQVSTPNAMPEEYDGFDRMGSWS